MTRGPRLERAHGAATRSSRPTASGWPSTPATEARCSAASSTWCRGRCRARTGRRGSRSSRPAPMPTRECAHCDAALGDAHVLLVRHRGEHRIPDGILLGRPPAGVGQGRGTLALLEPGRATVTLTAAVRGVGRPQDRRKWNGSQSDAEVRGRARWCPLPERRRHDGQIRNRRRVSALGHGRARRATRTPRCRSSRPRS